MLNIAFRADGGKNVGMGHIMRCLSLARAFQRQGHKVYFFSKLPEGIERVSSEHFEVLQLPSVIQEIEGFFYGDPSALAGEANEMIARFSECHIDVLVVDTYNISSSYFLTLKPYVKSLVYVDDVNQFSYPVDIVINGNITGEYMGYEKYCKQQVLLLGSKYNMIREEFCNLPRRSARNQVAEIMITTGGADPCNLTGQLLDILLQHEQCKHFRFNVLVGSGFTNKTELISLSRKQSNIVLYSNSVATGLLPDIVYSKVSVIMQRSDLAISAGGSTLYELAACGTPALAVILADNQELIVNKLAELGYVKSLGWYHQLSENKVISTLLEMINDYKGRQEMICKGQGLVDGRGADRIVQEIIRYLEVDESRKGDG